MEHDKGNVVRPSARTKWVHWRLLSACLADQAKSHGSYAEVVHRRWSWLLKLNRAHIVLIPKKPDAVEVGDFRPISLTRSAAKVFAKMLANGARKQMKEVVAANQSAFIKTRRQFLASQTSRTEDTRS